MTATTKFVTVTSRFLLLQNPWKRTVTNLFVRRSKTHIFEIFETSFSQNSTRGISTGNDSKINLFAKMSASESGSSDEEVVPEKVGLSAIPTWTQYFTQHELKPAKATSPPPEGSSEEEDESFKVDQEINDKISLWRGDITTLAIDAIVNAANKRLLGGGGVDGCIHRAAGEELLDECETLGGCPEGSAKITGAYALPCKRVIHAVGPQGEKPSILNSAYETCFDLMLKNELRSIAFPCISTGIYGYPQGAAAHVALWTARKFMEKNKDKVDRVIFTTFLPTDHKIYEKLMPKYFPTQ